MCVFIHGCIYTHIYVYYIISKEYLENILFENKSDINIYSKFCKT